VNVEAVRLLEPLKIRRRESHHGFAEGDEIHAAMLRPAENPHQCGAPGGRRVRLRDALQHPKTSGIRRQESVVRERQQQLQFLTSDT
jgi:hypothetical protein